MKIKYQATVTGKAKANHPDCSSNTELEYSDIYTIDTDYFYGGDDIYNYIKRDMLLVLGGGYDTSTVKNVKFNLNKVYN